MLLHKIQSSPWSIFSGYILVENGLCHRVTTMSECEEAARQTGLSDVTAEHDGQNGVYNDPPYCYLKGGSLMFNSGGTNTGACSSSDKCLCYAISCT